MKRLHIIGSSIQLSHNEKEFNKVTKVRSGFSTKERFEQTLYTIFSIWSTFPNDDIWIIDSSLEDIDHLFKEFQFVTSKVKRFYLKDIDLPIAITVNTHDNKSYCESLMLKTFLKAYEKEIQQYDFIIKISGRYFIDNTFELDNLTLENKNKLFIKNTTVFENDNKLGWSWNNLRFKDQPKWRLYSVPTVLYAFGSSAFNDIIKLLNAVMGETQNTHIDGEYLWKYLINDINIPIIEVPWQINGWCGVNKHVVKY